MSEAEAKTLRCDTCGKETEVVKRVVVDSGYNRANARPLYNCPECYEKKLHERTGEDRTGEAVPDESPSGR